MVQENKFIKILADDGFTLLEMVIVLFVVSIILTLPTINLKHNPEKMEAEFYIHRVGSEIIKAQNRCIMYDQSLTVEPTFNKRFVCIQSGGVKTYLKTPPQVKVTTNKENHRKIFERRSGKVTNIHPLNFSTPWGKYSLLIQLGSGRYRIAKE